MIEISPFGQLALMVEVADPAEARAFAAAVRRSPARDQVDVVPAERSVLVTFAVEGRLNAATAHFANLEREAAEALTGRTVEIPTVYDGEDLADVAEALGLSVAEVIEAHTSQTWTAAFTGFAPGFAYLTGSSDRLTLPRRASPRTAVPAGSVAIADRYSGIYPRASPGGWHLLGHTDALLWDSARRQPALIEPGDMVRFVPVDIRRSRSAAHSAPRLETNAPPTGALEILHPGLLSLIEDGGRPGLLHLGVPRSGAVDRASWSAGNEIVGNLPGAAAIETAYGGLRVAAHETLVLAITGACPGGLIDGVREIDPWMPFALRPGEELELLAPTDGVRSYLAVRGGIDVPLELGSRSMDVLTGIGGPPLAAGDLLSVGSDLDGSVDLTVPHVAMSGGTLVSLELKLARGADLFTDEAVEAVASTVWTITADSNRVGVRLAGGTPLRLRSPHELPSAGIVPGSVQVPPSGIPVVFLRDHPATGGYPVIGVISASGLDELGQAAVEARLRFGLLG